MEFSQRDVPWIKAGVNVIDQAVTAEEAAELGGLNFDVELWELTAHKPSELAIPDGPSVAVNNRFAVVRTDTNYAIAVVGSHYEPYPFHEAFNFMDQVSPRYVAAGVRRGGREGYMVVQAPDHLKEDLVEGEDPHDLYVVLRTSHDASKQNEVAVVMLRGKCTNMITLRGFSHGAKHKWGFRHTKNIREKMADARESLANIDLYVKDLRETSAVLANIDITIEDVKTLLEWALPDKPKRSDNVQSILRMYEDSETNGYAGTGWGVVNALTEWMDWGRSSKTADAKFINGLSGYSHKTVNRVAARLLTQGR